MFAEMKNIASISDKEIKKYTENKTLMVYEKLDMIYFKFYVTDNGYFIVNAKGKEIGVVDIITNSVYRDIKEFVDLFDREGAFAKYGSFSAGLFYLPVHKTKVIVYDRLEEGTFILSDIHTEDKSRRDDDLFASFVNEKYKFILGWNGKIGPYIGNVRLGDWFDKNDDSWHMAHQMLHMMGGVAPVSGNSVSNIEGLVICDGHVKYEIEVNDTKPLIEATSKLIYRDTLLESFIHTVPTDLADEILLSDRTYIEKICDLFLEYTNMTDFFKTMYFEEEDFLPPVEGYIGDVSYDMLPSIVSVVCKHNPVYKNVLRILLVTFCNNKGNSFDRFNEKDRVLLDDILKKANK